MYLCSVRDLTHYGLLWRGSTPVKKLNHANAECLPISDGLEGQIIIEIISH